MRVALVLLVVVCVAFFAHHHGASLQWSTGHHMTERVFGQSKPIAAIVTNGNPQIGQQILVHESPEVRTLRVWSDAQWWQTSNATDWNASLIIAESTNGYTLTRRRVFRPRGTAILVPAGVQVTVSAIIAWQTAAPRPPVIGDQRIYATIAPGMPQARYVFGGQSGPEAGATVVRLDPDNDTDTVSRIYGCRFADSVIVSWQQDAALGVSIAYQGGTINPVAREGEQRLSLDHKATITVPANATVQWTWSTFE